MTAAYVAALLLCLLVLAAAYLMQDDSPETAYPGRHRARLQIGQESWTS